MLKNELCDLFIEHSNSQHLGPKYPIYIPSKARPKCVTGNLFKAAGLNYLIVVEPQDYEEYVKVHDASNILVMDKNDQGIHYVRNFCKIHSKDFKSHWQFDDNIRSFKVRENEKNIISDSAAMIRKVESFIDLFDNVGICGFSHDVFAWTKDNVIDLNKQCYSGVLVNNTIDIWWRDEVVEDTDYSLQVLSNNYCTLLFNTLLIAKETTKKGNGGNDNSDDWRMKRSLGLQRYWPEAGFKITHEFGRVKVKPSQIWKKFKQMPRGKTFDLNPNDLSAFF
jgi:hypothetical protein